MTEIDSSLVARFEADLDGLSPRGERLGLAVSGGADSLALLLLGASARPGLVEAATVDHSLRPESRDEAAFVADVCARLGVPHQTLAVGWAEKPARAIQEQARAARYGLLAAWLRERELPALCTGHHRDDQAETLLMRLARGAGVRGLAGMRPLSTVPGATDLRLLRPLLDWSRAELVAICEAAGLRPIDDPSNRDAQFERVRARQWLGQAGLAPAALANSAAHLRSADEALEWATEREWLEVVARANGGLAYSPGSAPAEIRRRIVARAIGLLATEGDPELRGQELDRLLAMLESGGSGTLRGVLAKGGRSWRFDPAPSRSSTCG